jgi:hypothetical protein
MLLVAQLFGCLSAVAHFPAVASNSGRHRKNSMPSSTSASTSYADQATASTSGQPEKLPDVGDASDYDIQILEDY